MSMQKPKVVSYEITGGPGNNTHYIRAYYRKEVQQSSGVIIGLLIRRVRHAFPKIKEN